MEGLVFVGNFAIKQSSHRSHRKGMDVGSVARTLLPRPPCVLLSDLPAGRVSERRASLSMAETRIMYYILPF